MSELQKDLVLSINEYAYVLDRTKGNVSCWVGPVKTSLSTSDELVRFNERTKQFEGSSYEKAVSLFTTAPENWYVILKNPAENDKHPQAGTANSLPENVNIGKKVNIRGPVSFALYPGQMAKVIKGHALRSNQYLLARVYEAAAALEKQKQDAYAETVSKIMASIGPDLVAAMTTKSNEDMLSAVTEAMAPYAIAKGESIAQTVNTLLRGTSLEGIIEDVNINV